MRAAPPVEAALDAGRLERMLITLLHALAGAVLAAWSALHAELHGAWLLAAVLAAATLMAVLGHWLAGRALPLQPGSLRWDGQVWSCVGAADIPLQRLVVALDLGLWMLLRLHLHPAGAGGPLWRVASARGARSSWHGLRVALAMHAGIAAPAPGEAVP